MFDWLWWFGAFWVSLLLIDLILFVLQYFVKKEVTNFARLGANQGAWAVVTGATDGIGKAYALELARRRFNVFLISRTEAKLREVAQEISDKHKVETDIFALDFTKATESSYTEINDKVNSLRVGVLVNNVGINYEFPRKFLDGDSDLEDNIVKVNILAVNKMTKIVLNQMVNRKAGAIINVSSATGVIPTPMLAVYSGTKAYVDSFSQAISAEYKSSGILIQSITPNLVVSNMSKVRRSSMFVPSASTVARNSLGRLEADISFTPYYVHRILESVLKVLPRKLVLDKLLGYNLDVEKRGLRKQAANAAPKA